MDRIKRSRMLICLIVSVTLIASTSVPMTYAGETNEIEYGDQESLLLEESRIMGNIEDENQTMATKFSEYQDDEKTKADFKMLAVNGFLANGEIVSANGSETSQETSYTVDYDGIQNEIVVIEHDQGEVTLIIKQGEIANHIVLTSDYMTIDGEKVVLEDSTSNDSTTKSADNTHYWTKTCPYDKAANYTHSAGTANRSVTLPKKVKSMTFAAFLSVVTSAFSGAGVVASVVASNLYDYLLDTEPTAKGFSGKTKSYTHKNYTSGYIKPKRLTVTKIKYTWYTKVNYKGDTKKETWYRCIQW